MALGTLFILGIVLLASPHDSQARWWWGRRCNRVDCRWGVWSRWQPCSHPCGNTGTTTRTRSIALHPACGGRACTGPSREISPCNRFCHNGGTPERDGCRCAPRFHGRCCNNCVREDCNWTTWSEWGSCSRRCGGDGVQYRSRRRTGQTFCGGNRCNGPDEEARPCNRFCKNGGTLREGGCSCTPYFHGPCCDKEGDPCDRSNHRELYDILSSRSNYTQTRDVATCDRYAQERWYRVISPAGGDMINTCPAENTCSTNYPIWMEGDTPSADGLIHRRTAFVHVEGNCSADKMTIQVKNCTKFNIYYLIRPTFCPTAYCFGHIAPCPDGESSPTGREPNCTKNFPPLTEDPVVNFTVKRRNSGTTLLQLVLLCNLTRPKVLPPHATLHVIWFRYRNSDLTNTTQFEISPRSLPHELQEEDWPTNDWEENVLNTESGYYCIIRVTAPRYSSPSPWRQSAALKAGIMVQEHISVSVNDLEPAQLDLKPSMPILNFDLNAEVNAPESRRRTCRPNPRVAGVAVQDQGRGCGVTLRAVTNLSNWQEEWKHIKMHPSRLRIWATYTGQNTVSDTMYINITTIPRHFGHPLWENFYLPIVTVFINNNTESQSLSPGTCHSQNDPHMRTFDGCVYDMHLRGEFIFYRNNRFDSQVNIFTKECSRGSRVSCNCGLTVRSGENSYTINYCDDQRTRIGFINCTSNAMKIERKGNGYSIILTTGGQVSVSGIHSRRISRIAITASPRDFHQTEGLCGRHNGNSDDDFYAPGATGPDPQRCQPRADDFARSWKVESGNAQSLWNGYQGRQMQDRPRYCKCGKTRNLDSDVMCNPGNLREECTTWGSDITQQQQSRCSPPQKLQRVSTPGSDFSDMTAPPVNFTDDPPSEPPVWRNGWNESTARAHCQQSIMGSPPGRQCRHMAHMDFSSHIDDCVKDVHATGGTDWVVAGFEGLVDQCNNEVQRNTTTWEDDGETARPPPAITRTLCPSNCNERGQCVDSLCRCYPGFGSSDCSIDMNQPPNITGVPNDGKCDSRQRPCRATPVTGTNLADSHNLTCRISYSNISSTGAGTTTGMLDMQATYMHDTEIMCPFYPTKMSDSTQNFEEQPMGQVYKIAVSNNGMNYSRNFVVVKYDGKCMDCDSRALACGIKRSTCHISGGCYFHGEASPRDPCKKCDPNESATQWTTPALPSCRIEGICYNGGYQLPDKSCLFCDPPTNIRTWTLQDGNCFIDSRCVKAGTRNSRNETQICNPQMNKYSWTSRERPPHSNNHFSVAVALVVLGCVAGVGVATTGAAVFLKKTKRNRKVAPAPEDQIQMSPAGKE